MALIEPKVKNTFVFVDGQNLYRAAKDAFGYNYPNYDIKLLSKSICFSRSWNLSDIYFYTGVPDLQDDAFWHNFWSKKLSYMGRSGIKLFPRSLRYHNKDFKCPSCNKIYTSLVGHEKGVDVRLALDIIRFAHERLYDVALIFSQDQDLTELAAEVRMIAKQQNRWIKIDRQTYDSCIDTRDYRNTL